MQVVLEAAGRFHEELNQPGMVQRTATWSWDRHPWSSGAFAYFQPGQHTDLYASIIRPEGRIFFAGEHASLDHSWMQGALQSALRAVDEMARA
jgi:monoamine oxidase